VTNSHPAGRCQYIRRNVAKIRQRTREAATNSLRMLREPTYNQMTMDSKLANESRRVLVASAKRLTHEERLRAFVRHSKLVMDLAEAAKRARTKSRGGG
jgi:hypothetical protein